MSVADDEGVASAASAATTAAVLHLGQAELRNGQEEKMMKKRRTGNKLMLLASRGATEGSRKSKSV